jgi:hypothetical protein
MSKASTFVDANLWKGYGKASLSSINREDGFAQKDARPQFGYGSLMNPERAWRHGAGCLILYTRILDTTHRSPEAIRGLFFWAAAKDPLQMS